MIAPPRYKKIEKKLEKKKKKVRVFPKKEWRLFFHSMLFRILYIFLKPKPRNKNPKPRKLKTPKENR